MLWQPPLPARYDQFSEDQLTKAIYARKGELGSRLIILGHHYQQDSVIRFTDFMGDSFKLSQLAAQRVRQAGAEYVIFCGVHFMAETADLLTDNRVKVVLPDLGAGCSMADMADYDDTLDAWQQITEAIKGTQSRVIPICYMNSTAAIKAFCGEHGGAVCTSSNCDKLFTWALAGGETPVADGEQIKILFLPDQHLGRNTAVACGFDVVTDICLWDPKHADDLGGCNEEELSRSTFILWKGHCSVHKLFRPEHIDQIRTQWPDVNVIVHPECVYEVAQGADMTGSTEHIIKTIESAEPGTRWAIGTEVHLVNRLCNQAAQRGVQARILSDCQCLCTTMYRIDLPHLLWTLDNLAEGHVVNRIRVNSLVRRWALVALDRMLTISARSNTPPAKVVANTLS